VALLHRWQPQSVGCESFLEGFKTIRPGTDLELRYKGFVYDGSIGLEMRALLHSSHLTNRIDKTYPCASEHENKVSFSKGAKRRPRQSPRATRHRSIPANAQQFADFVERSASTFTPSWFVRKCSFDKGNAVRPSSAAG